MPQVDLSTRVTKNIVLRTPIVSSPMDTVTEAEMAITMATVCDQSIITARQAHTHAHLVLQLGGMGFVHYNNTVEEQVAHVYRAKRHVPGYIATPLVLGPTETVAKIDQLKVSALRAQTGRCGGAGKTGVHKLCPCALIMASIFCICNLTAPSR
jgi:IMP dehydrogenase